MPAKKEDPTAATHFSTNHHVGAFRKGQVVTAAEIRKSFGRDKDATPEEHEQHQADQLKRLLDLGAISPAEAPEEHDADVAAEAEKKAAEEAKAKADADRKAAEETRPQGAPHQQPKK